MGVGVGGGDSYLNGEKKQGAVPDKVKCDCYKEGVGGEIVKKLIKYVTMTG